MFANISTKGNKVKWIKIGITNCYLIHYEDIYVLVDTGQKAFSDKLRIELKAILPSPFNLDYLVLTHTHYDHVQNAKMIQTEFHPKVIVHKNEVDFLKNGFTRFPKGTNVITYMISALGNKFAKGIGKYDALEADILVHDDYFIDNKPGLKIIETAGHTIGSISLIIDDEIAIVGDTLFGVIPNKGYPPFADHKTDLFRSWEKLLRESCEIFLPGHGKKIGRSIIEKELKKRYK